jgi:hypothetical protein
MSGELRVGLAFLFPSLSCLGMCPTWVCSNGVGHRGREKRIEAKRKEHKGVEGHGSGSGAPAETPLGSPPNSNSRAQECSAGASRPHCSTNRTLCPSP